MATPRGRSRRPTPKQIAALKYLITESKDGRDLTKRILFFLIDASKGMTRNVSVGLSQDREGYTAKEINEAGHGMSSLQSCNCSTHLDELTTLMGCRLGFSLHYGAYDEKGHFSTYGQFAHQDGGFDAPMLRRSHALHLLAHRGGLRPLRLRATARDLARGARSHQALEAGPVSVARSAGSRDRRGDCAGPGVPDHHRLTRPTQARKEASP
jgi:hypothetical protein